MLSTASACVILFNALKIKSTPTTGSAELGPAQSQLDNVIIVLNSTLWVEEEYSRLLAVVLHDLHGVQGGLGRHQVRVQGDRLHVRG